MIIYVDDTKLYCNFDGIVINEIILNLGIKSNQLLVSSEYVN